MLYIASALTPTPVSHTVKVDQFTSPGTLSIIVGKPDRVEVWDVGPSGLTSRGHLETWGPVEGLATVSMPNTRPHVLVLLSPPNARLLLLVWDNDRLVVTASQSLAPPTPGLREQEFLTGVIAQGSLAFVSVWTGLLGCIEMEVEKERDAKRRRSSVQKDMDVDGDDRRILFKGSHNINIREHNLLDVAFGPLKEGEPPMVTFLWMSEYNKIQLQPRQYIQAKRHFDDHAPITDIVNPLDYPVPQSDDVNFEDIPFSCPAGRKLVALPTVGPRGTRLFLVAGDEYTALYSVTSAPPSANKITNPRASAARRSPQSETGGIGKKRKSSLSGRSVNTDNEERWLVQPVWRVRQGWGTVIAATVLSSAENSGSVLLGDEYGHLTAIGWQFDDNDRVAVGKVDLGSVSPPTALTYITNGYLFVSSAGGDSLLVSLDLPQAQPLQSLATSEPRNIKGKGRAQESTDGGAWTIAVEPDVQGRVDVKERWMNLAPVKDFVVVEEDDGRMSHLVVASGSATSNSLRIVRSGAGLENVLTAEGLAGIQKMWSLAAPDGAMLVVSFATSTAVLRLEPELSVAAIAAGVSNVPTLAVGLVGSGALLAQVTPGGVQIWSDLAAGTTAAAYSAPEGNAVVAGAVNGDVAAVSLRDGTIIVLKLGANAVEEIATGRRPHEAVAIAVVEQSNGILVAVSEWNGEVALYDTASLARGEALATRRQDAFTTSMLFEVAANGTPRLVTGLSDGSLVSCDVDAEGIASSFAKGHLHMNLGSLPLQVAPVTVTSEKFEERVVAVGISDRFSVVFESRGHLEFSASGKKNVVAAASVSTPSLGSCIVLATADGLYFERLTSLKKLQVLTLDLGDFSPTRLAYVPHHNVLAVGGVTRTLDAETGDVMQSSSLELRHPTTLEFLADYQLPEREAVASVNAVFINGRQYIALGTAIFESEAAYDESNIDELNNFVFVDKGRLILLDVDELHGRWTIDEVETVSQRGAVFDATAIHGFLAIAASTQVTIMRLVGGLSKLEEVSSFAFAFEPRYLDVLKDKGKEVLVLGDAMRSVIVIEVDEESGEIHRDQRDMCPHGVRALNTVRDGEMDVLLSDECANLLTYRVLAEELEPAASFGLHEDLARLRKGAFVASHPDDLRADVLFATANGRLGIIGELGKSATRTLQDLQRNMNKHCKGPGNLDWRVFRRGGNALVPKETAGFIDGDFVQGFLDAEGAAADKILHGATAHEHVAKIVGAERVDASREDVVRVLEATATQH